MPRTLRQGAHPALTRAHAALTRQPFPPLVRSAGRTCAFASSARSRSRTVHGRCRCPRDGSASCSPCCCCIANETLSSDRLIDALWGEAPPATRREQPAQPRLRSAQGARRRPAGDARRRLRARRSATASSTPGSSTRSCATGRAALAAGDPERAAGLLREALELWHGPALGDLAYHQALAGEAEQLEEARLAALEERIEADLARGRHADVVAELEGLVARHPLRERLRGQQMVALYRSGRQADALAAYRDARERLSKSSASSPARRCGGSSGRCSSRTRRWARRMRCRARRPPVAWARRHAGAAARGRRAPARRRARSRSLHGDGDDPSSQGREPAPRATSWRRSIRRRAGHAAAAGRGDAGGGRRRRGRRVDDQRRRPERLARRTCARARSRTYSTGEVPLDIAAGEDAAWLVSSGEQDPSAGSDAPPATETLSQLERGRGAPVENRGVVPRRAAPRSGARLRSSRPAAAPSGRSAGPAGCSALDPGSDRSSELRGLALGVATGDGQVWTLATGSPRHGTPATRSAVGPRSGARRSCHRARRASSRSAPEPCG